MRKLLCLVLALFAAGCSAPPADASDGFADDRSVIQIVSTNVQGKNVYIPGTIVVTAGKGQTLQIYNTTDVPHGFSIAGLGIEEILPPKTEHEVKLSGLEGGNVHHIHCHLHPAHRSGTLLVLRGE
ncbi:MAG: cupredoxin domain-containing protein [Deltaproteobacteria bacterium]|nr:cupredoxin domain-containing protein [Deltaproteobacteria bacterium]MBW2448413.1 cupredoxin domain-containing protein [Deltaproteobacteria bacterium]